MKFLLLIILAISFTWSFSREEPPKPEIRLVTTCPGIEDSGRHSRDIWRYMDGNKKAPGILLSDYTNSGHNAFGVIRTM